MNPFARLFRHFRQDKRPGRSVPGLRVRILDRYLAAQTAVYFLVGFSFFNLIFIIPPLLQLMDLIIVKQVPFLTVMKILIFMLPKTFALTIHISVLPMVIFLLLC